VRLKSVQSTPKASPPHSFLAGPDLPSSTICTISRRNTPGLWCIVVLMVSSTRSFGPSRFMCGKQVLTWTWPKLLPRCPSVGSHQS